MTTNGGLVACRPWSHGAALAVGHQGKENPSATWKIRKTSPCNFSLLGTRVRGQKLREFPHRGMRELLTPAVSPAASLKHWFVPAEVVRAGVAAHGLFLGQNRSLLPWPGFPLGAELPAAAAAQEGVTARGGYGRCRRLWVTWVASAGGEPRTRCTRTAPGGAPLPDPVLPIAAARWRHRTGERCGCPAPGSPPRPAPGRAVAPPGRGRRAPPGTGTGTRSSLRRHGAARGAAVGAGGGGAPAAAAGRGAHGAAGEQRELPGLRAGRGSVGADRHCPGGRAHLHHRGGRAGQRAGHPLGAEEQEAPQRR